MKSPAATIFPRTDDWLVGTVCAGAPSLVIAKDEAAIAASLQSTHSSLAAWLALPSRDCLTARISTVDLPRRGRELAMQYRLEEHIPWAAEETSAAFGSPGAGATLLAVAARKQGLQERVDQLNAAGVEVLGAAPAMALCAANLVSAAKEDGATVLVIGDATAGDGDWISLVQLDEAGLAAWYLLPGDVTHVLERLRGAVPSEDRRVIVCDLPVELQSAIEHSGEFRVTSADGTANERACLEVQRLADRRAIPLVDLHPSKRVWPVVQLSCAIVLTALTASCVGLLWRMHRYDGVRAQYENSSEATFTRLFPASPVPAGVVSRLVAEARELRGKVGDGQTAAAAASLTPALARVLTALNAVDPAVRFKVSDFRMDGDHLSIAGQTARLDDVDAVAQAITSNGAWIVSPPHSEQQGSSISFTLDATPLSGGVAKADGSRLP
jgi:hypothetical protein